MLTSLTNTSNRDFSWEVAGEIGKDEGAGKAKDKGKQASKPDTPKPQASKKKSLFSRGSKGGELPTTAAPEDFKKEKSVESEERPFELKNLKLKIARGSFVAIVGKVNPKAVSFLGREFLTLKRSGVARVLFFKRLLERCVEQGERYVLILLCRGSH